MLLPGLARGRGAVATFNVAPDGRFDLLDLDPDPIGVGASGEERRADENRVTREYSSELGVQRFRELSSEAVNSSATIDTVVDLARFWPRSATARETHTDHSATTRTASWSGPR